MKTFSKVFDSIINFLAFIGGALCIVMMLGISADVVGRYFLKLPIQGMIEANEIMIVYIIFIGSAWLAKEKGFINMDVVLNMFKSRARAWLNIVTSILSALMSVFLFWYGLKVTLDLFQRGTLEPGQININMGFIILAIPLGCLPLCIQFFRQSYQSWKELGALKGEQTRTEGLPAGEGR